MINYSTVMRGNPADKSAPKKAFATAQYSDVMELDEFARHIASHGCVYSRADIAAVLTVRKYSSATSVRSVPPCFAKERKAPISLIRPST